MAHLCKRSYDIPPHKDNLEKAFALAEDYQIAGVDISYDKETGHPKLKILLIFKDGIYVTGSLHYTYITLGGTQVSNSVDRLNISDISQLISHLEKNLGGPNVNVTFVGLKDGITLEECEKMFPGSGFSCKELINNEGRPKNLKEMEGEIYRDSNLDMYEIDKYDEDELWEMAHVLDPKDLPIINLFFFDVLK